MEKIKTIFCASSLNFVESELVAFCDNNNQLYINIYNPKNQKFDAFIELDFKTAVKLVKHLRREISYMKEGGKNV
jgi:hypothetical protein